MISFTDSLKCVKTISMIRVPTGIVEGIDKNIKNNNIILKYSLSSGRYMPNIISSLTCRNITVFLVLTHRRKRNNIENLGKFACVSPTDTAINYFIV